MRVPSVHETQRPCCPSHSVGQFRAGPSSQSWTALPPIALCYGCELWCACPCHVVEHCAFTAVWAWYRLKCGYVFVVSANTIAFSCARALCSKDCVVFVTGNSVVGCAYTLMVSTQHVPLTAPGVHALGRRRAFADWCARTHALESTQCVCLRGVGLIAF